METADQIADRYKEIANAEVQKAAPMKLFGHAGRYWKPPFRYVNEGTMIVDANGSRILDVRGWGHLTGKGSLGLMEPVAERIQDEIGATVAVFLNTNWPR